MGCENEARTLDRNPCCRPCRWNPRPPSRPCFADWRARLECVFVNLRSQFSIPRHVAVNFIRPRGDAAFDALDVFETLLAQKPQRFQRTDAGFAMQIILRVRIQLREAIL